MAEKSTFFNSVSGDRKYKAEDMAAHFAKLITNGVYPAGTQLQVTEDAGMRVIVSAGSAWINGYAYHNDNDFTLDFDAADGVLNRIDRIVVRWGRLVRSINLVVIKGTPASSPTAPAIVRSADYYDLGIATVEIDAGITAITQSMITDTRLDSSVCGFVSSLIQPDTSGWFDQFNSAFTSAIAESQSAWDIWFETVQDVLDENTAGNLLNLINDLAGSGRTTETVKGVSDALASHMADAANKHKAANISVVDAAEKFTASDVEGALSELFTFANDGKTGIANAVTAKGVAASPADTFATLAAKIGQIEQMPEVTTGDQIVASSDEVRDNSLVTAANRITPNKVKDIQVFFGGSIRVSFALGNQYNGSSGDLDYAQIYKNGQPIGTIRSQLPSTTYTTYTEDITGVSENDHIQIYVWLSGNTNAVTRVKEFRIKVANGIFANTIS